MRTAHNNKKEWNNINLEIYKIIILGDFSVGKTAIINRYATDSFNPNHRVCIF